SGRVVNHRLSLLSIAPDHRRNHTEASPSRSMMDRRMIDRLGWGGGNTPDPQRPHSLVKYASRELIIGSADMFVHACVAAGVETKALRNPTAPRRSTGPLPWCWADA